MRYRHIYKINKLLIKSIFMILPRSHFGGRVREGINLSVQGTNGVTQQIVFVLDKSIFEAKK